MQMMAVISDIHGNFPALQAVMAEIQRIGCDRIISLGDVAGYYCQINECIECLFENDVLNIMGNHDYYMVYDQPCPRSRTANDVLRYQRQHITLENLGWLGRSVQRVECHDASFVHGGWKDPLDEYLAAVTEDYFRGESAAYFFSGHTHVQKMSRFNTVCYCNPGSVGQPRDNDARAAFALFDGREIHLRRVEYNIDKIALAMQKCGFDSYFYAGLYAGEGIGARQWKKDFH